MTETLTHKKAPSRLGTEKVGKLLLEFSIPAIIGMICSMLYNIVDTIFLGHALGEVGVAVTTLAIPVMTVLMGFSLMAGQGGNALTAILMGQGRHEEVEETVGNTTLLLIILALVIALLGFIAIDPILVIIGTSQEIYHETKVFVQIIMSGFITLSLGMGMNNFLRTMGKPNLALGTNILGTASCIILNWLFVIQMRLGIEGSAVATIMGQGIAACPVLWYMCCSKQAAFHIRLSKMRPKPKLMFKILSLGIASFVMQVAATLVSIVLNQLLTHYSSLNPEIGAAGALASIGVAQRAALIAIMPLVGLIIGAQPIIGYNFGAKNWQRVLDTLKLGCLVATIFATAFFVVAHLFPYQLIGLFGIEEHLHEFSSFALKLYTIFFPLVGFQIMGSSYFQSSGQPIKSAILEMTRQIIFLIPLYLILPPLLEAQFGVDPLVSIILSVPLSDILAVLVTSVFVFKEVHKLRKLIDEANNVA